MFPAYYLAGLAVLCAFWAEMLTQKEDEVIPFVPKPQRHVHVGGSAVVVALR